MENRIKAIRAEKNLSQEVVAERAKISRTTLSLIENGKATPDGDTIAALVKALGVPANLIFFELNVV